MMARENEHRGGDEGRSCSMRTASSALRDDRVPQCSRFGGAELLGQAADLGNQRGRRAARR